MFSLSEKPKRDFPGKFPELSGKVPESSGKSIGKVQESSGNHYKTSISLSGKTKNPCKYNIFLSQNPKTLINTMFSLSEKPKTVLPGNGKSSMQGLSRKNHEQAEPINCECKGHWRVGWS